ncbi:MAG: ATPase [Pseudomonadota bacterium]
MRHAPLYYPDPDAWATAPKKRVALFGMSGLGKTHLSTLLRLAGGWFHYSVDYRIGTRYMGELIADSFKREAMRVPYLADLLRSDSIYIASNITFDNLDPLSTYLGKPGDPAKGGLPITEYRRRQSEHEAAEIAALLDATRFIDRAEEIYGYENFICDTGGSICEVVEPNDPDDHVMRALSEAMLLVWIEGTEAHRDELIRRFDKQPKPMAYQPAFLNACWEAYLAQSGLPEEHVDPDAFVRFTYGRALAHRQPRYAAMAQRWGVTVPAEEAMAVRDEAGFHHMILRALERAMA